MKLIVDIGNSRTKLGLFADGKLTDTLVISGLPSEADLISFCTPSPVESIAISSVGQGIGEEIQRWFPNSFVLNIDSNTATPITSTYSTPSTLGIDRICGMVAASKYFPTDTVLVIDMGTCVTYDIIDSHKTHLGGGISPGYKMRLDAMHHFTAKLPNVSPEKEIPAIGTSTEGSLLFGAGRGLMAEVEGIIAYFSAQHQNLKVILTGGNHSMVEQRDENATFAAPNLILEGIHFILLHNEPLNE